MEYQEFKHALLFNYLLLNSLRPKACRSTLVEYVLQIDPFMQNKPNFLDAQINISAYIARDYEDVIAIRPQKNKPNSNPIKPNFRKAQNVRKRLCHKGL